MTQPSISRVVITNVYPDDNRGSAALTLAAVRFVQEAFPSAVISLMTPDPDEEYYSDRFRHTLMAVEGIRIVPSPATCGRESGLRSLLRGLSQLAFGRPRTRGMKALRESELVLSRGAVVFVDRLTAGALLSLFLSTLPLLLARRTGIPVGTLPTHVGPFSSGPTKALARWTLQRLDIVMVRDVASHNAAHDLGVDDSRLLVLPDSVLHLTLVEPAPPFLLSAADVEGVRFGVFTISADAARTTSRETLFSDLSALADELLRKMVDRIIVVDQVSGSRDSDVQCSRDFVSVTNDHRVRLCELDLSVEQLLGLYSCAEFVVGCRLHANLLALVAGTPGFPISVSYQKAERVFGNIGLGQLVIPFPSFDVKPTAEKIVFWTSGAGRAEIFEQVRTARESLGAVTGILQQLVESRG